MTRITPKFAFLEHDGCLAFAHRGGAGDQLENTMEAFAHAVALGYRYVETDVHATEDGVLLAFHDDKLDRVTDRRGRIAAMPHAEVRQARVGGHAPIPLLQDVLASWPEIRLNIDPKSDQAVRPLINTLKDLNAVGRVCITSFSDRRNRRIRRELGDEICTGMGPGEVWRLAGHSIGLPLGGFQAGCAQVPLSYRGIPIVTRRFVAAAHRHNLQVHVWTVDCPDEMARLLDLGVDGLMTDQAAVLKQVLSARGKWQDSTPPGESQT